MTPDDAKINGMFFFHRGDDTGIVLKRASGKKPKPRKRK